MDSIPTQAIIENLPDIKEVIYNSTSVDQGWNKYVQLLKAPVKEDWGITQQITQSLYANKLEEFRELLTDSNLYSLESDVQAFKEYIRPWCKKHNVRIVIKKRSKDFIGLNEKIRLFIKNGWPLSRIHDLIGFRIILCTAKTDTQESVALCYELFQEVVNFFVLTKRYSLVEAEQTISTGFNQEKFPSVVVPEKSLIPDSLKAYCKDYVAAPKVKTAYQSLHTIIEKDVVLDETGQRFKSHFEVQIRTFAMDIAAEHTFALHLLHKSDRYDEDVLIDLDFSKVNIPGFSVLPNGDVEDLVGLVKSTDPFNLL